MTRLQLGINTCFAVKRWPEPEDWAAVVADDLGLRSVQLSLDLFPPSFDASVGRDYATRTRAAAADRELDIHSLFTGLGAYASSLLLSASESRRQQAVAWYAQVLEFAALSGARGAGGHIGALSVPSWADRKTAAALQRDQIRLMRSLSAVAADLGLTHLQFENLAVEREYGSQIEEAARLDEQLGGDQVPWILCLDLGHPVAMAAAGTDPLTEWLRHPWQHAPVIQLQQASAGSDGHLPFTDETNRAGGVDRDRVLTELAAWGDVDVHLFIEVIPAHETDDGAVLRDLVTTVEYWRDGIEAFGLAPPRGSLGA